MGLNLKPYLRQGHETIDVVSLAGADATGVGEAENHAFMVKLCEARAALDQAGVNDAQPRLDFRFWQGMISGLQWRGDLIAAAKRHEEG